MKCLFLHNPLMLATNKLFQSIPVVRDTVDHISNIVLKGIPENYKNYLFCIGSVALTIATVRKISKTWSTWEWVFSHGSNLKRLTRENMLNKYGDCWVAITGFADGIGWAFANLFSELGYNLILIGRNQEKINQRAEELDSLYPNTRRNYIVADLSTDEGIDHTVTKLEELGKTLEIGIFINNAGFAAGQQFLNVEPSELLRCSKVNVNAAVKINQTIVPILLQRKKRSALINLSSCTGIYISPNTGIYSMTKKIIDVYTRTLEKELGDKMDVVTVRPFGVTTKMMKMKKGPFMITPMECAKSTIADTLAGDKITYTGAKHKMSNGFFRWLSEQESMQIYQDIWTKGRQQSH